MREHIIYKIIAIFLGAFLLASCSEGEKDTPASGEYIISSVTVERVSPVVAPSTRDDEEPLYPGDVDPIIISSFNDSSLLYISQMGTSESTNPNFTDTTSNAASYCYIYQYYQNDEADWDNEYNFKSLLTRKSIDWRKVKSLGSVGNAFSFFSFFFPVNNKVTFQVKTDQRGPGDTPYDTENFMVSDIMGAYHATSSLYTRLRFRLYHLMTYLKITLYVPEHQTYVNNDEFNYSGFDADALVGAYVLDASTGIDIEWRANRSSDTDPPLTQPTSAKSNIAMYCHKPNPEVVTLKNLKQYYTSAQDDTDNVRVYNFSVLFPGQVFNGDFLCFVLKDTDNQYRYYYFNSGQVIGSTGDIGLTQGTLQKLYLYLPRKTNETILIGANILPWSEGVTDMTVSKETTDIIDEDFTD